jgi:hypothetical protein
VSQQINLFNPIFLKQKKYFSALTMVQGLGMILAGALALSVFANFQLTNLEKDAAASSQQLKTTQAQLATVTASMVQRTKSKALEEQIRKAEADVASLQAVFDILNKGEVGNTKGYSEYMRAFARQIGDGLWLTGFNIGGSGNDIGIQGRALRPELVPAYINRLKHEQVMQGKSFATLEMQVPAEKSDATGKSVQSSPGYIEFNLRSSETSRDQPSAGVNTK